MWQTSVKTESNSECLEASEFLHLWNEGNSLHLLDLKYWRWPPRDPVKNLPFSVAQIPFVQFTSNDFFFRAILSYLT